MAERQGSAEQHGSEEHRRGGSGGGSGCGSGGGSEAGGGSWQDTALSSFVGRVLVLLKLSAQFDNWPLTRRTLLLNLSKVDST